MPQQGGALTVRALCELVICTLPAGRSWLDCCKVLGRPHRNTQTADSHQVLNNSLQSVRPVLTEVLV